MSGKSIANAFARAMVPRGGTTSRRTWQVEVWHDGLGRRRVIRGTNEAVVDQKVAAQEAIWNEMWAKRLDGQRRANDRNQQASNKQAKRDLAARLTQEAQAILEERGQLLTRTLVVDDMVDWEGLKDQSRFPKPIPEPPQQTTLAEPEPKECSTQYEPKFDLLDSLFASRKLRKKQECRELFERDQSTWVKRRDEFQARLVQELQRYETQLGAWEKEEAEFKQRQKAANDEIEAAKAAYLGGQPGAVSDYCDLVLSNSKYPDEFPQQWELDYNGDDRSTVVDYVLPSLESLTTLREVKYVQTRDEFDKKLLSESAANKLYNGLIYQIALRTVHELLEADAAKAIDSVVFNGWVDCIDNATGKDQRICVVSLQAQKDDFLRINLAQVDPKACFESLGGVGSAKLHTMKSIVPLRSLDNER